MVLALRSSSLRRACRPLLAGEPSVWERAGWKPGLAPVISTGLGLKPPACGRPSREAGLASFAAVRLAVRLAGRGLVHGIVTAPISKEAWSLAGVPFADHTEYLGHEAGAQAQMLLGVPSKGLWCVLATRHIPLSRVAMALSVPGIVGAARALREALRRLGKRRPLLGLCAFNPHAGEGGLLGLEEKRILIPAAALARRHGILLQGPIPADTAWRRHLEGRLDGLVCLYHDQALIPLKTAGGLEVVNWTAGLPFARTSPGHGTGYDAAERGPVDPRATIAAAELAARLCRSKGRLPSVPRGSDKQQIG